MREENEVAPLGFRSVKKSHQVGDAVKINGNSVLHGKAPRHQIVGYGDGPFTDGYGLTPGVDKDFFERWMEQNLESAIVRNKLVLAYDRIDDAIDAAKDHVAVKNGLEPLLQDKDPRTPRAITRADNVKGP